MAKSKYRDHSLSRIYSSQLSKEEEAVAFARGDRDTLVRSVIPWVLKVSTNICRKKRFKDTDAAFSAALVAVNKSLDTFNPEKSRLITYCSRPVCWAVNNEIERHGIIKHSFITDAHRVCSNEDQTKKGEGLMFDISCDPAPAPMEMQEEVEFVREYRWLLNDAQRISFDLITAGVDFKEAAVQMGLSRESVRNHYKNAIRKIRDALVAEGVESPFVEKT